MTAFADEVANARIWSGFHYRFSTRVGTDMGLNTESHWSELVGPLAQSDGHDAPRLIDELVPGLATMVDEIVV
jgi:hypothetical protein